jgi:hypothetical protein
MSGRCSQDPSRHDAKMRASGPEHPRVDITAPVTPADHLITKLRTSEYTPSDQRFARLITAVAGAQTGDGV